VIHRGPCRPPPFCDSVNSKALKGESHLGPWHQEGCARLSPGLGHQAASLRVLLHRLSQEKALAWAAPLPSGSPGETSRCWERSQDGGCCCRQPLPRFAAPAPFCSSIAGTETRTEAASSRPGVGAARGRCQLLAGCGRGQTLLQPGAPSVGQTRKAEASESLAESLFRRAVCGQRALSRLEPGLGLQRRWKRRAAALVVVAPLLGRPRRGSARGCRGLQGFGWAERREEAAAAAWRCLPGGKNRAGSLRGGVLGTRDSGEAPRLAGRARASGGKAEGEQRSPARARFGAGRSVAGGPSMRPQLSLCVSCASPGVSRQAVGPRQPPSTAGGAAALCSARWGGRGLGGPAAGGRCVGNRPRVSARLPLASLPSVTHGQRWLVWLLRAAKRTPFCRAEQAVGGDSVPCAKAARVRDRSLSAQPGGSAAVPPNPLSVTRGASPVCHGSRCGQSLAVSAAPVLGCRCCSGPG